MLNAKMEEGGGAGRETHTFSKLCTAKVPPETESSQASRAILREGLGEPSNFVQRCEEGEILQEIGGGGGGNTLLKRPVRRILSCMPSILRPAFQIERFAATLSKEEDAGGVGCESRSRSRRCGRRMRRRWRKEERLAIAAAAAAAATTAASSSGGGDGSFSRQACGRAACPFFNKLSAVFWHGIFAETAVQRGN
jgi:hypothetical protein